MAKTESMTTLTNAQVRGIYESLLSVGRISSLPHKLDYAGIRNRPRLKDRYDEVEDARASKIRKFGQYKEGGELKTDRQGNLIFANAAKEAGFRKEHKELMAETMEFDIYTVKEEVIKEIEDCDYNGGLGFLDALVGTVIIMDS